MMPQRAFPSIAHLDVRAPRAKNRRWDQGDNYKWYVEEKVDGSQLSVYVDAARSREAAGSSEFLSRCFERFTCVAEPPALRQRAP